MIKNEKFPIGISEDCFSESKIRILTMSDDPRINTGFGIVHKNLIEAIRGIENVSLASIGWFSPLRCKSGFTNGLKVKFENYEIIEADKQEDYGIQTFKNVIDFYKPHAVITIGDPWMVKEIPEIKTKNNFIWFGYTPIDGLDLPRRFVSILKYMDYIVSYGKFGTKVLNDAGFKENIITIPHGVNTEAYKPLGNKEEIRKKLGIGQDEFIILWNGRNTPRKRLDIMLEAFSKFISPSFCCRKCKSIIFKINPEFDLINKNHKCTRCGNYNDFIYHEGKEDARLFIYTTSIDVGFDIDELIYTYDLQGKLYIPTNNSVGIGISDKDLGLIYNSADVFVNTSTSEGWGMPIHEAMACGLPVLVPNFGGYVGSLVEHGVNGICYGFEILDRDQTGYIRCKPHQADLIRYLDHIYFANKDLSIKNRWEIDSEISKDKIKDITECAVKKASSLDWELFSKNWNKLIANLIPEIQIKNIKIEKNNKKRILIMLDNLLPLTGGAEVSIFEVAKILSNEYDIVIAYNNEYGKKFLLNTIIDKDEIKIIQCAKYRNFVSNIIDQIQPDIIFTQLEITHIVSVECKKRNIPYDIFIRSYEGLCSDPLRMATCHFNCTSCSSYYNNVGFKERKDFLEACCGARQIYCNSKYMFNVFKKFLDIFQISDNNVSVLYPYINKENINIISSEFAQKNRKYITMFKGTEAKGSLVFIKTMEEIQSNPAFSDIRDYEFLIAGKLDQITTRYIKEFNSKINILQSTDNPSSVYNNSAVIVFPSIWKEPFGRVCIEAYYNDVPVITSGVGGLKEISTSWVEFSTDHTSWALAIKDAIKDPESFLKQQRIYLSRFEDIVENQYEKFKLNLREFFKHN